MDRNYIVIAGSLNKTLEGQIRRLVISTLDQEETSIEMVVLKVDGDYEPPEIASSYLCTMLVKTSGGLILRVKDSDCDELLAVYKALDKIRSHFKAEREKQSK